MPKPSELVIMTRFMPYDYFPCATCGGMGYLPL